ncbi:hypothetical protein B566_EDAN007922 [Ephemera danica]|nr:hypothetical protein B566_EDAN007922 [Ephemera danica]
MSWELYSAQMFYTQDAGSLASRLHHPVQQMGPECGNGGGCSRPGCAGARLMHPNVGDSALLAAEAELLQQHQQQQASQKPYRVGLILLCVGALFNWLGLAQAYVEPMRYIGVGCIVAGALLICAAMCRWLGRSSGPAAACRPSDLGRIHVGEDLSTVSRDDSGPLPSVHVISFPRGSCSSSSQQHEAAGGKPPDYESLVSAPPSYEDAIKLRPTVTLLDETSIVQASSSQHTTPIDDVNKNDLPSSTGNSPRRCER